MNVETLKRALTPLFCGHVQFITHGRSFATLQYTAKKDLLF